jgi:hypothetical protein
MKLTPFVRGVVFACAMTALGAIILTQCTLPEPNPLPAPSDERVAAKVGSPEAVAAWDVIYKVLQHPRCMNCHPAADAPLQGDKSEPHQQSVMRGKDGHGITAMKCQTCHQEKNLVGEHLPPGGPDWHLPKPEMKLVFEGRTSIELCRQLQDRKRNDNHSMEEIFEHMDKAPLVLWGWDPGNGRAPVPTSHADLMKAVRTWMDNDCGCP